MKNYYFLFSILLFMGCKTTSETVTEDKSMTQTVISIEKYEQLADNKDKEVLVPGKIVQEEFVNKGGRATGIKETLIELKDGKTVHIRNKGENKYEYDKLVNKNVEMKAVIFYGNIDSDNPEHQSRVGYRIDYTVITVLD